MRVSNFFVSIKRERAGQWVINLKQFTGLTSEILGGVAARQTRLSKSHDHLKSWIAWRCGPFSRGVTASLPRRAKRALGPDNVWQIAEVT